MWNHRRIWGCGTKESEYLSYAMTEGWMRVIQKDQSEDAQERQRQRQWGQPNPVTFAGDGGRGVPVVGWKR